MSDDKQKKIFSRNLLRHIEKSEKTQKEIADSINVSPQTFNTWCQGIALPRMGKVQALADYFNIKKSDLLDEDSSSEELSPKVRSVARGLMDLSDDQLDSVNDMIQFLVNRGKEKNN